MARDLAQLLKDTAQAPRGEFDADRLVRRARRQTLLARSAAGLGVVALLAIGAVVATQLMDVPSPTVVSDPARDPAPVSVLDRPAEPEDALPREVVERATAIDEDAAASSRLARSTQTRDYYVVRVPDVGPRDHVTPGICLAVWEGEPEPTVGCASWGPAGEDGVLLRVGGPFGVAGIAADGVDDVGGATVVHNVFVHESDSSREQESEADAEIDGQGLTKELNEHLLGLIEQAGLEPQGGIDGYLGASNSVTIDVDAAVSIHLRSVEHAELGDVTFEADSETSVNGIAVRQGRRSDATLAAEFDCGDFRFSFQGKQQDAVNEAARRIATVAECPYNPESQG